MKSRLFPAFSVRLADIQITNSLVGKYAREHICPSGNRQKIELYDIGVIGNYGDFPRFSFKGEKDIDPLLPLTFHYPLLRYFKASIRNKENRLDVYK